MKTRSPLVPVHIEEDSQQTLDRIRRCIEHPPQQSRIFTITPNIAETLLREYHTDYQRPKKPNNIARYADDMQRGRWPLTGDTVKFSAVLEDGQNRLMACIRAGVPFITHIVFGIDHEAFDRLDQGRNRDGSDVLAIAGYQNTKNLAGAVRWTHLIETGRVKQRDTYQPPQIRHLLQERYSKLPDFIHQARLIYGVTKQPPAFITAVLYLFHKVNPDKAGDFAAAWSGGQWAGKFKPIGLMQGKLASLQSNTSGRVHDVVRAALVVIAWNLFIEGRKGRMVDMVWELSEPFPEIRK